MNFELIYENGYLIVVYDFDDDYKIRCSYSI